MREIGDQYKGIASPALRRDRNDLDMIKIVADVSRRDRNDLDMIKIVADVLRPDRNGRNKKILFDS
jgi:hypothetical protein